MKVRRDMPEGVERSMYRFLREGSKSWGMLKKTGRIVDVMRHD